VSTVIQHAPMILSAAYAIGTVYDAVNLAAVRITRFYSALAFKNFVVTFTTFSV
jgi:hypothetical protein